MDFNGQMTWMVLFQTSNSFRKQQIKKKIIKTHDGDPETLEDAVDIGEGLPVLELERTRVDELKGLAQGVVTEVWKIGGAQIT